jgi:HIV Tat-specific factor 1
MLVSTTTMAAEAEYWTFPTNPEEFDQDERISYSKLDNKYIAVQDDGTEYEFDDGLKRWIPMIDEALIEEQQKGYMMPNAAADTDRQTSGQGRKRKMDHLDDREVSCAHMLHICSVGHPARRHALHLPP